KRRGHELFRNVHLLVGSFDHHDALPASANIERTHNAVASGFRLSLTAVFASLARVANAALRIGFDDPTPIEIVYKLSQGGVFTLALDGKMTDKLLQGVRSRRIGREEGEKFLSEMCNTVSF
ncbi:MAG TPA: hypothetical protein VNL69_05405, partial [Bacteroidota bacterium]|nr:hypothetical protein [Bacteroidota bacterium]